MEKAGPHTAVRSAITVAERRSWKRVTSTPLEQSLSWQGPEYTGPAAGASIEHRRAGRPPPQLSIWARPATGHSTAQRCWRESVIEVQLRGTKAVDSPFRFTYSQIAPNKCD